MLIVLSALLLAGATSSAQERRETTVPAAARDLTELWSDPIDLQRRDFYNGPWGPERAPDPDAIYTFVAPKKGGINPGMTVRDPAGRHWKVKQPPLTGRGDRSRVVAGVVGRRLPSTARLLPAIVPADARNF
jgi:hypothetical protein